MQLEKVILLQTSSLRVVHLSFQSVARDVKENREEKNWPHELLRREAREMIPHFVHVSSTGFHAAIFPRGFVTFSLDKLSERGITRSLTNWDKTC